MSIPEFRTYLDGRIAGMRNNRYSWWLHWRELADFILPRRYRWLVVANQFNRGSPINYNIIDSTGTLAARTLASGITSGVASPTRPWFKLKIEGFDDDYEVAVWLSECERRMMRVFQESNFYEAMAILYFDLVVFGSACIIVYEDYDNVINCFNPCLGEFFFDLNQKNEVRTVGREFTMTFDQMRSMFGDDAVGPDVQQAKPSSTGSGTLATQEKVVMHLMEKNEGFGVVPSRFPWRESFWYQGMDTNRVLRVKGYYDWPCLTPRWDVSGNDPYGRSPGMDALGDVKQLQQETKRKAQAIDKMVNPPMIADVTLKNQPASLLPGGVTYVAGLDNSRAGMKPVYTVMPPIQEMMADIREIQQRIKITFNNDLFTGITDLQTVRTATEIDARREEKLVLLGPVLERILGEGLGPAIDRTWGIMWRGRLLPPPPRQLAGAPTHIQIDYISMLAMAQKGLATAAIEKVWAFAGNIAAVRPDVLDKLNVDATVDEYSDALGVSPKIVNSDDMVKQIRKQRAQQQAQEKMAAAVPIAADSAKTLSDTNVGGGINALQLALGQRGAPS